MPKGPGQSSTNSRSGQTEPSETHETEISQVYLVLHSYDDDGHDEVKMIGAYSTQSQAEDVVERFKPLPGFRHHVEGFHVSRYPLNKDYWVDGFGVEDDPLPVYTPKSGDGRAEHSEALETELTHVYPVWHSYDDGGHEEDKLIGVYSTQSRAEDVVERFKHLPGFRDHAEGLCIDRYPLNKDYWVDGFGFEDDAPSD